MSISCGSTWCGLCSTTLSWATTCSTSLLGLDYWFVMITALIILVVVAPLAKCSFVYWGTAKLFVGGYASTG